MTAHDRHDDPLDPNERELARILRALPGHEPSVSVDTGILKAAQNALATPAKSRRRWLWAGGGWGLGTAAAAVLTVGVSWQLLQRPSTPSLPPPSAQLMSAPKAEQQRLSVELLERPPREFSTPPPPESDAAAETAAAAQAQRVAPPAAAKPQSPPAPTATPEAAPEAFDEALRDHAEGAAAAPAMERPGTAPANQALAKRVASEPIARDQATASDAWQRARSDVRLIPQAWLQRIQKRIDDGDLAGARASLALFRERHPEHPVPATLIERLRE